MKFLYTGLLAVAAKFTIPVIPITETPGIIGAMKLMSSDEIAAAMANGWPIQDDNPKVVRYVI